MLLPLCEFFLPGLAGADRHGSRCSSRVSHRLGLSRLVLGWCSHTHKKSGRGVVERILDPSCGQSHRWAAHIVPLLEGAPSPSLLDTVPPAACKYSQLRAPLYRCRHVRGCCGLKLSASIQSSRILTKLPGTTVRDAPSRERARVVERRERQGALTINESTVFPPAKASIQTRPP